MKFFEQDDTFHNILSQLDYEHLSKKHPDNVFIADYLPKKATNFEAYSSKEIYYDGIEEGDVAQEDYEKLLAQWKGFLHETFSDDTIFLAYTQDVDEEAIVDIAGSKLVPLLKRNVLSKIADLEHIDALFDLCFSERIYGILVSEKLQTVVYLNGFHCPLISLDHRALDIVQTKLNQSGLHLWQDSSQ